MIAVFPGTFDPFTAAHRNIVDRALRLFAQVDILLTNNHMKDPSLFDLAQRQQLIERSIADLPPELRRSVTITAWSGLLADYVDRIGAGAIIRGVRDGADLAYERKLEQYNQKASHAETVYLTARSEHVHTSSTLVRMFLQTGKPDLALEYVMPEAREYLIGAWRK